MLTLPLLINAAAAVGFGLLLGFERQLHKHEAGLRTNALTSLGACAFVFLSMQFNDSSQTRVLGQVCSGLGFLGAGVILKDGLKIHGLTTAATIWVSGAVGSICGTGRFIDAAIVTGFVVAINLLRVLK
jgi:putative Mg2+ transporter-C (MgtC) family protein